MTQIRNVEADLARFRTRVFAVSLLVLVCFSLLAARLVYLQVVRHDDLRAQAESNRTSIVPIVPNRGLIVDRNGMVLANNYSAYTLEITPSQVDDVEADHRRTGRDRAEISRRAIGAASRSLREESKRFESIPIRTRLSDSEVARFAAQRFRFPGVEIQARLFRQLPLWRARQPCAGLHRAHQPARSRGHARLARRRAGQLPGHRAHRQAGHRAEVSRRELHGITGV
jgi:penicillin-binding protein 2